MNLLILVVFLGSTEARILARLDDLLRLQQHWHFSCIIQGQQHKQCIMLHMEREHCMHWQHMRLAMAIMMRKKATPAMYSSTMGFDHK
jgi:hypothetical protein